MTEVKMFYNCKLMSLVGKCQKRSKITQKMRNFKYFGNFQREIDQKFQLNFKFQIGIESADHKLSRV